MTAQRLRMDVIAQNIANAITTETEAGGPYRRQVTLFGEGQKFRNIADVRERRPGSVNFGEILSMTLAERRQLRKQGVDVMAVIKDDNRPFTPVYDPTHPHADEDGYYWLPNVDVAEEQLDLMAATHSYNNNIAVYDTLVGMAQRTLSMGRN
jgi:flagellar basal-body rod protein FlgC